VERHRPPINPQDFIFVFPKRHFKRVSLSLFAAKYDKKLYLEKSLLVEWYLIHASSMPTAVQLSRYSTVHIQRYYVAFILERSGDISGRTTAILQFSSELEQTWHSYY
jgi:hypothetical protein